MRDRKHKDKKEAMNELLQNENSIFEKRVQIKLFCFVGVVVDDDFEHTEIVVSITPRLLSVCSFSSLSMVIEEVILGESEKNSIGV